MNTADPRHVVVIASQCKKMTHLARLREAANNLQQTFLNQDIGACENGLPGDESLLYGELIASEIEARIRAAIRYAATKGASLVLVLLGHGFIAGTDPTLYFMGWDSEEEIRDSAIDVGKFLVDAADRPGVKGVIGVIDTCTAAGAQPRAAQLATGTRNGQTQLSLLMASSVGQEAYDMSLSRNLAELLRTGVAGAGPRLHLTEVTTKLRAALYEQNLVSFAYDGDQSSEPVWLAYNQHVEGGTSSLGPHGTAVLVAALENLDSLRDFPMNWDITNLYELRQELGQVIDSPDRTRAARVVDGLIIAQKTISFLRSFMPTELTSDGLRRALAALAISGGSPLTLPSTVAIDNEVDAIEHVALAYPRMERSCKAQMTRFVLKLTADAELDIDAHELRDWAASIGAIVALNDALAAQMRRRTERRLRLIVSLHYTLAGEWPEALGAWLLYDEGFYKHQDFDCTPDQPGAEEALAQAVDWAEDYATTLGATLRRIEIAVPTKLLLRWRPEEVEYGSRLGVNYDVLTRWSQRLDPQPTMRRINRNAGRRLEEIAACVDGSCLHWLDAQQVNAPTQLYEELREGRYAGAIGLMDDPGENDGLFEVLLQFAPIVLWPQTARLSLSHCRRIRSCWHLLPEGFLTAYRARWRAEDSDPIADLRAVWDDKDWLEFCRSLQMQPSATQE